MHSITGEWPGTKVAITTKQLKILQKQLKYTRNTLMRITTGETPGTLKKILKMLNPILKKYPDSRDSKQLVYQIWAMFVRQGVSFKKLENSMKRLLDLKIFRFG